MKFRLGRLLSTRGALEALRQNNQGFFDFVARHKTGDWGDVCDADKKENDLSLKEGFRLLSAYTLKDGTKIWLITEADRSATTILLPEEY